MNVSVRDLVVLSDTDLSAVQAIADAAFAAWASAWLPSRDGQVQHKLQPCARRVEASDTSLTWQPASQAAGKGIWIQALAQHRAQLANALQGCPAHDKRGEQDWALPAADDALADLTQTLADHLGSTANVAEALTADVATLTQAYAGALIIECQDHGVRILLTRPAYAPRLPKRAAKAPRPMAVRPVLHIVAPRPLPLQLSVGETTLTLQDFLSLHAGDVIRLNASLHDPLDVQIDGKPTLLKAYAGCQDQHVALKLASSGAPSVSPAPSAPSSSNQTAQS